MHGCPSVDQLRDLLADRLSASAEAPVAAHVETCSVCQLELETLAAAEAVVHADELASSRRPTGDLRKRVLDLQETLPRVRTPRPIAEEPTVIGVGREANEREPLPTIPGYELLDEI